MPTKTLTQSDRRRLKSKLDRIQRRPENTDLTRAQLENLQVRLLAIQAELRQASNAR